MRMNLPNLGRQGDGLQHVLIVGGNERTEHLVERITGKGYPDCHIEGFLDDDSDRSTALEQLGVPYLGPLAELERLMIGQVIDCVYICLPLRSYYDKAQNVLDLCNAAGVPVFLLADFLPLHSESGDLWCIEPLRVADAAEGRRGGPVSAPQNQPEGIIARVFAVLSAAFSGLVSIKPAVSRQQGSGVQSLPFPIDPILPDRSGDKKS